MLYLRVLKFKLSSSFQVSKFYNLPEVLVRHSDKYRDSLGIALLLFINSFNHTNPAVIIEQIGNNIKSIWRPVSQNTNEYMIEK